MQTDPRLLLVVVVFLGLTVLGALAGGVALSYADKAVPEFVVAIGSGAAGSLGTLLANPSTRAAVTGSGG